VTINNCNILLIIIYYCLPRQKIFIIVLNNILFIIVLTQYNICQYFPGGLTVFTRKIREKSRFCPRKNKKRRGERSEFRGVFCFFTGKSRLFEIFQVRTRFYEAGPAITHVLPLRPVFSRNNVARGPCESWWGVLY
jgi:hypothetical protein